MQVDDHDQLTRELEESTSRSQPDDSFTVTESRRTHRRHSEPVVTLEEEDEVTGSTPPPATQPVQGLTPHLERLGAKRGRPAIASRRSRMSMPAQLHIAEEEETNGTRKVQFEPLTAQLDGRSVRRLRRSHLSEEVNEIEGHKKDDAKIRKENAAYLRKLQEWERKYNDLLLELETARLGNIDVTEEKSQEQERVEQELEEAREQIAELKASWTSAPSSRGASENPPTGDFDDDDNDGLVLVEPEDLSISQEDMDIDPLPNGIFAIRALETSQVSASQVTVETIETLPQTTQDSIIDPSQIESVSSSSIKISSQATKRYENEINSLATQLGTTSGALRLLTIHLQNLNILRPGADANAIVAELQNVLEKGRAKYERMFAQDTSDLTGSEFITKLIEELEGLNREIAEKVTVAQKYYESTHLLRQQNNRLLDITATTLDDNENLALQLTDLEETNNSKDMEIDDLDQRTNALQQSTADQDRTIRERDEKITRLEVEATEKDTDSDRLRQALEGYRRDLDNAIAAVRRLEEEHAAEIARMVEENDQVILAMQTELDQEATQRDEAEAECEQKTAYIDELESRVLSLGGEVDAIGINVVAITQRLTTETTAREVAQADADEQTQLAYDRAVEIENLKETVQDLNTEVDQFRTNLDLEREQREETETALDEANREIEDLTTLQHDAGIQANELRSKLFQVQQEKDDTIRRLKEQAAADAEEQQELLDTEGQNRQMAEDRIADLESQQKALEKVLLDTEASLAAMTRDRDALEAERDDQAAKLKRQLEELQKKFAALESTSNSTINSLQATITDLTNELNVLRAANQRLQDEAAEAALVHAEEIASRDATIDNLNEELTSERVENEKLTKKVKSLEERVEEEANEVLNITGAHIEETNALRQTIATLHDTISNLQAAADQRAAENAEEIATKTQEIEDLRIVGTTRAELIATLELQLEELKQRFREHAEESQYTIDALVETNRHALEQQELLAEQARARTLEARKAVDEMKIEGISIKTNGANLKKVVHGKVTKVTDNVKVTKKKRGGLRKSDKVRDSGFVEMLSDPELDELENGIEA